MQSEQIIKKVISQLIKFKNSVFCVEFRTKSKKNNIFCANNHTLGYKDCESWICTNCTICDIINTDQCKGGAKFMDYEFVYDYNVISKYIISKCNDDEQIITNLRLQKILYYVQGYFIKKYSVLAFDSDIEAWQYGPVVPDSYFEYCANGAKPIVFDKDKIDDYLDKISERKYKRLIDEVINKCMSLSITSLVNKTHGEMPWCVTIKRDIIDIKTIAAFFNKNDPLELGAK